MKREIKQLIYLSILLLIFIIPLISLVAIKKFSGTCDDGIKNQRETGIDCGGPCPPCELKEKIIVRSVHSLINRNQTFDIIAKIENHNQDLGLKNLKYQFLIYDINNVLKDKIDGETVLFPGETRYLIKIAHSLTDLTLGKVELKIIEPKAIDWIKMETRKIKISSYNEKLLVDQDKLKMALSLYNSSSDYYPRIEIIVLVYDQSQNLLTLGRTETTIKPYETKDLTLFLGGGINLSKEKLKSLRSEIIFQEIE